MKKFIATILLSLAVAPAFAGDLYDTVSSQRIMDTQSMPAAGDSATPLYRQVTGKGVHEPVNLDAMTEFTFSPLYLKVTDKMG